MNLGNSHLSFKIRNDEYIARIAFKVSKAIPDSNTTRPFVGNYRYPAPIILPIIMTIPCHCASPALSSLSSPFTDYVPVAIEDIGYLIDVFFVIIDGIL